MRGTPVVPYQRGPFQTPVVPDAIVANVAVLGIGAVMSELVESNLAGIQATLLLQTFLDFVAVCHPVRLDQQIEHLANVLLLV